MGDTSGGGKTTWFRASKRQAKGTEKVLRCRQPIDIVGSFPEHNQCGWRWPGRLLATAKNFGKTPEPEATVRWLFSFQRKCLAWTQRWLPGGFRSSPRNRGIAGNYQIFQWIRLDAGVAPAESTVDPASRSRCLRGYSAHSAARTRSAASAMAVMSPGRSGQFINRPSSSACGRTCQWKCGTDCAAPGPLAWTMLRP